MHQVTKIKVHDMSWIILCKIKQQANFLSLTFRVFQSQIQLELVLQFRLGHWLEFCVQFMKYSPRRMKGMDTVATPRLFVTIVIALSAKLFSGSVCG